MTQRDPQADATDRAASLIARALGELQSAGGGSDDATRSELAAQRAILSELSAKLERHLAEEREQHLALGGQLTTLAGSLDRLVGHLQGLSTLMTDLLGRLAEPASGGADGPGGPAASEPVFQPGGEGVSLTITGVPGFQGLMEIQKGLTALDQVSHASVERFQEGDSRLLVSLTAAVTASEIVAALNRATGQAVTVEESKPELARLRVKVVPGA